MPIPIRTWAKRVRVLDHANETLDWISGDEAREHFTAGRVEIFGTGRKIHSVRFNGSNAYDDGRIHASSDLSKHRARMGDANRRENYYNIKGEWQLDRIPDYLHELFTTVVDEIAA